MDLKTKIKRFATISQVAKMLNTSQPNITQRIKRESLTFAELQVIADACKCSVAELLQEEGEGKGLICPHCGGKIQIEIK